MKKELIKTFEKLQKSEKIVKIDNAFKMRQYIKHLAMVDDNNTIKETYQDFKNTNNNNISLYDIINDIDFINDLLSKFNQDDCFNESDLLNATLKTTPRYYYL